MVRIVDKAREANRAVTVPTAVIVEWWRDELGQAASMLDDLDVEDLTRSLAREAASVLRSVQKKQKHEQKPRGGPSVVDAIVMATAARRDRIVYTGDMDDLVALRDSNTSLGKVEVLPISPSKSRP